MRALGENGVFEELDHEGADFLALFLEVVVRIVDKAGALLKALIFFG